MNDDTTVLFGLPGVRVARVEQVEFLGRAVHVRTAEGTSAPGRPGCGVVSTSVKDNVITAPRDILYGEGDISVRWHKTRWRCNEPSCVRSSFTETITEVPAGRRTTGRLRRAMGAAVGDAARSVSEVADVHRVSWPTAHAAFVEHADALLTIAEPTTVLGIDETRRGKPRWVQDGVTGRWRRVDPYDTQCMLVFVGVWSLV